MINENTRTKKLQLLFQKLIRKNSMPPCANESRLPEPSPKGASPTSAVAHRLFSPLVAPPPPTTELPEQAEPPPPSASPHRPSSDPMVLSRWLAVSPSSSLATSLSIARRRLAGKWSAVRATAAKGPIGIFLDFCRVTTVKWGTFSWKENRSNGLDEIRFFQI